MSTGSPTADRICRGRMWWRVRPKPRSESTRANKRARSASKGGRCGLVELCRSMVQHELAAVEQRPEHILVERDVISRPRHANAGPRARTEVDRRGSAPHFFQAGFLLRCGVSAHRHEEKLVIDGRRVAAVFLHHSFDDAVF